jgi:hypothetical protein
VVSKALFDPDLFEGTFINEVFYSQCELLMSSEITRGQLRVNRDMIRAFALGKLQSHFSHFRPIGITSVEHYDYSGMEKWNVAVKPKYAIKTVNDVNQTIRAINEMVRIYYRSDIKECFGIIEQKSFYELTEYSFKDLSLEMVTLFQVFYSGAMNFVCRNSVSLSGTALVKALKDFISDSGDFRSHTITRVVNFNAIASMSFSSKNSFNIERKDNKRSINNNREKVDNNSNNRRRGGNNQNSVGCPPRHILDQIPRIGGKTVCLKFQSARGCPFGRDCGYPHERMTLPPVVKTWAIANLGPLNQG